MKTTRSELVSIINSLNLNLKNDYYRNAYEDAENLFVLTQHPHFFNVALYCKYMFSVYFKSINYLTSACNNGSIREYLRAIYSILDRRMDLALESFGKSSKYSKDPLEEVSLFNIEITNDLIIFEEEMNTIPGAVTQNTHALSKISHLSFRGFLIKLTDAYSPEVNELGKISMNRALKPIFPTSVKELEKTETRQKQPEYPIERYHRIEAQIGDDNLAINRIWLFPKPKSRAKKKEIDFLNCSTLEFIFVLFLIYERECKEEYWLDGLIASIKTRGAIYEKLKEVFKWCDKPVVDLDDPDIISWWNDRNKRGEPKRELIVKGGKAGLKGDLVKKTPERRKGGSYELNRCLIEAEIIRPKTR